MVGKVRLNFGSVSFKVRLVLFWSGIRYRKLFFWKYFRQFYLRQKCHLDIYIQWNSDNTTTHWTALNWSCERGWGGRVNGVGVVASHLYSWRFHVLSRSLHF